MPARTLGELYTLYGNGLPPPPVKKEGEAEDEWAERSANWVTRAGRILKLREQAAMAAARAHAHSDTETSNAADAKRQEGITSHP